MYTVLLTGCRGLRGCSWDFESFLGEISDTAPRKVVGAQTFFLDWSIDSIPAVASCGFWLPKETGIVDVCFEVASKPEIRLEPAKKDGTSFAMLCSELLSILYSDIDNIAIKCTW